MHLLLILFVHPASHSGDTHVEVCSVPSVVLGTPKHRDDCAPAPPSGSSWTCGKKQTRSIDPRERAFGDMFTWYCRGQRKKWSIPADLRVKVGGDKNNSPRRPVLKYELVFAWRTSLRRGFSFIFDA